MDTNSRKEKLKELLGWRKENSVCCESCEHFDGQSKCLIFAQVPFETHTIAVCDEYNSTNIGSRLNK